MKTKILILIFLFPFVVYGQNLCKDCAVTFVKNTKRQKCCNKCIVAYYTSQLNQNITQGDLSKCMVYKKKEIEQMPTIPDSLCGVFKVCSIKKITGYYWTDKGRLKRCSLFLVVLSAKEVPQSKLSSIVLVTIDNHRFVKGNSYPLTLKPYFNLDQGKRIIDGREITLVQGPKTLFDIVYQRWLICKLEYGTNYFFCANFI